MPQAMMIGELARRTGTKVNTIRFYEDIGLLRRASRTASGRRVYDDADLQQLSFVRRGRSLGFSVDEIRSLLVLAENPERDCAGAAAIAREHLHDIEERIARLQSLRDALSAVAVSCDGGRAAECRIMEAIADWTMPTNDQPADNHPAAPTPL